LVVTDADACGRAPLALWHRNGAQVIGASAESRALAGSIIGEAMPAPLPRGRWLQRLSAKVLQPCRWRG